MGGPDGDGMTTCVKMWSIYVSEPPGGWGSMGIPGDFVQIKCWLSESPSTLYMILLEPPQKTLTQMLQSEWISCTASQTSIRVPWYFHVPPSRLHIDVCISRIYADNRIDEWGEAISSVHFM